MPSACRKPRESEKRDQDEAEHELRGILGTRRREAAGLTSDGEMPAVSVSPEPYLGGAQRITPVLKPPTRVQNPMATDTSFAGRSGGHGAQLGLLDFSPPNTPTSSFRSVAAADNLAT